MPDPEPEPEPDEDRQPGEERGPRHPLDPLGLGDGLRDLGNGIIDLLTPRERREAAEAEADADADAEAGAAAEGDAASDDAEEAESGSAATDRRAGADAQRGAASGPDAGDTPPATEEEATESGESATETDADTESEAEADADTESDAEPDSDDADPGAPADPFAPDADGRIPFPCPEERAVAGSAEDTAAVLANDPWLLEASYLTLAGLKYHGVVNVTTDNGSVKQALKFTAARLDIGDLHQIVDGGSGLRHHVQAAHGSNSTFRDGTVTMYTERLEGKLFGLIPVVFDPRHEPPLDLPIAHFTDVLVTQAAQFGGTLTMPGMRQYMTYG
ncbi:hypothetical protein [Streptomyces otsuchiensis]|uniref:hypothetical protein n=1 Tax=Streptomyces otsuchiensis TaxID=2681388 RepID=UPI0010301488|nr:hypothetical protein [Streptomyces otsuchiensis]